MATTLEAEFNNWSVQDLKDVLDQFKQPSSGLKKALISRLITCGEYTYTGPDYERWTITAIKSAAKKKRIPGSISKRSLLIHKLKQAQTQKENANSPSPKRLISGATSPKAVTPPISSPPKRRAVAPQPAALPLQSPSPTITISPRRRKQSLTGPISKRETSPIFGSPTPSPPLPPVAAIVVPLAPVIPMVQQSPPKRPRTPEKQARRSDSPPKPTPVKGILSPRKPKLGGETPKKSVVLGEVAIRHFPRCHGGSLGMPHSGGYPIGLDWKHSKETRSPLHEYESMRHSTRKSSNDLEPMSEDRRKQIAEATGAMEELEDETAQIRSSRTRVGCSCSKEEWGESTCLSRGCICVLHGISCSQDACDCDDTTCKNPLRDRFESDKVDKLRREKLVVANQELQTNSSPLQNLGAMVRSGVKRTLNFLAGSPTETDVSPAQQ